MIPNDEMLDRLIRETQRVESPEFRPPPEAVIRRYLLGTASVAERHLVREAMEQSSEYRQDVLELAEAVDAAVDQARADRLRTQGTPMGPLPEWLTRALSSSQDSGIEDRRDVPAGASFLRRLRVPIAIPAFALAILALFLISRAPHSSHGIPTWELISPAIEKELLISMNTRGGAGLHATAESSPADAAIAAFRPALKLGVSGEFEFQAPPVTATPEPTQTITLRHPDGSDLAQIRVAVPDKMETSVWILTLPDRSLRTSRYDSGARSFTWNPVWGRRGCVTFIQRDGTRYRSSSVAYFSF